MTTSLAFGTLNFSSAVTIRTLFLRQQTYLSIDNNLFIISSGSDEIAQIENYGKALENLPKEVNIDVTQSQNGTILSQNKTLVYQNGTTVYQNGTIGVTNVTR